MSSGAEQKNGFVLNLQEIRLRSAQTRPQSSKDSTASFSFLPWGIEEQSGAGRGGGCSPAAL